MSTEIPRFDYDQYSDNVRSFIRFAIRDDEAIANTLTFAQGEALVQKLAAIATSEARKMVQPYIEGVESVIETLEKQSSDRRPGNLPL